LRSVTTLALVAIVGLAPRLEGQSPAFARFVDRYLDDFARRHPSIAAGNGIHDHDDRLDDFSAVGIAAEVKALERDGASRLRFENSDSRRTRRSAHPARHHRRVAARAEDAPELAPKPNAVRLGTR
jgi:hypothetical protein